MRIIIAICLVLFFAHTAKSQLIPQDELIKIFPDSVKTRLNIQYPIYKAYRYKDDSGSYIVVLTEKFKGIEEGDTLQSHIRAICVSISGDDIVKKWEINDAIQSTEVADEMSIWFWTKYCRFEDLDKDELIDPLIIYGSYGINYMSDGRIRFILVYKGNKIVIRHQNGTLDFQRNTQVNADFYILPVVIQQYVQQLMTEMAKNDHAIFPYGWQEAMKQKKIYFDEN